MERIREIIQSALEPEDKHVLWIDISNPDDICIKMYNEGEWKVISASGIFGNYITPTDLRNILASYATSEDLANLLTTITNKFVTLTEEEYTQLEDKNSDTYYYTYEEE
jgi:hypothetical protein